MTRVYNFSAGPAVLPLEVLEQVREELVDWKNSGMSVMEMSHRGAHFKGIAEQAEQDLRELLAIPDNFSVLFLQGGATTQFSAAPMNLSKSNQRIDYVVTGSWGKKAAKEGSRYADANVAADAADSGYTSVPPQDQWDTSDAAAFLHYTPNETIGGVEFHSIPESRVPLVADMSSTILSRPVDVSRFGVIYAGAQKNVGPAGLTLVIIDNDLLGDARPGTPTMLDYSVQAAAGSMSNTPPTFAWYVAGLVFDWIKQQGGLTEMARRNRAKKDALYNAIDNADFYSNPVDPNNRSWMNVPFILAKPELDATFLEGAREAGLENLKGHRSVGGMRASIYNAMPQAGVDTLIEYMHEFERLHG